MEKMKKMIAVLITIILFSSLIVQPIIAMAEGTDDNISEISQITSDGITEVEDVDDIDEEDGILDYSEDIISEETVILEEDESLESAETEAIISEENSSESSVESSNEVEGVNTARANAADSPIASYTTHVETYGWQSSQKNGATSGTTGKSKRLEAIKVNLSNKEYSGGIQYRTHIQNIGWQGWKSDGALSGTTGQSKRLEAIEIKLTGEMAEQCDVYYRVHAQNYGWMGWAKNGESAGTAGYGKRLEAIEIVLVKKGGSAPGSTTTPFKQAPTNVNYSTHIQNVGWQSSQKDGATSGTSGQSKRLEGIKINLSNKEYSGSIQYRTHVQTYGWQEWKADGALSGTTGQSKRLEAIEIKLTGEMANHYDVYYRVHAQNYGWMGWAKNGESAGTSSQSKRLEAIQVVLVEKGTTFNEYGSKLAYSSCMLDSFKTLGNSQQVILVTTSSYSSRTATMKTYEKSNGAWKQVHSMTGVVGKKGMTDNMSEGAQAAPTGKYTIGTAFGRVANPGTKLSYRRITSDDVWVDDPNSSIYNTWQKASQNNGRWKSAEKMDIPEYDLGFVINYNTTNPIPGAGSAIFFHVEGSYGYTLGCTATTKANVSTILKWLDPSKNPVIIQTPESGLGKY